MEKQSNLREISFGDIWRIFVSKLWIMILSVAIVVSAFYIYNKLTFVPRFEATATLYILRQSSESDNVDQKATEDFSLALNVVNDCDHMLKSHIVLEEVIKNLNLDISYKELKNCVSTSNPDDTRILEVTVEAATKKSAKLIVDEICRIGEKKIEEVMDFDQVNIFEQGVENNSPSNSVGLMTYILIAMVVGIAVYSIYLLRYLFDDRIKTDAEIERYLELTVIGDIPNAYGSKNGRGGKYKYYGYGYGTGDKYGYGYGYTYGYGKRSKEKMPENPDGEVPASNVDSLQQTFESNRTTKKNNGKKK